MSIAVTDGVFKCTETLDSKDAHFTLQQSHLSFFPFLSFFLSFVTLTWLL